MSQEAFESRYQEIRQMGEGQFDAVFDQCLKDLDLKFSTGTLGRQARLDHQVASIEEHREAFQSKVLEVMQEFLSFTQVLNDD